MIQQGANVRINYKLRVDGEVVDSSEGREPLTYEHGADQIIPGLQSALETMEVGDTKSVTVEPKDAYGEHDPERKQDVPREAFPNIDELSVGDQVSGQAGGRPLLATVAAIGDDAVTLDLNHPLAGKTLDFEVELLSID
ncbi:MAG: FKBP-type peptidyl-prolyl cis-trans isomerase [Planctomycetota bacterium]